jgi:hypothetical protein
MRHAPTKAALCAGLALFAPTADAAILIFETNLTGLEESLL